MSKKLGYQEKPGQKGQQSDAQYSRALTVLFALGTSLGYLLKEAPISIARAWIAFAFSCTLACLVFVVHSSFSNPDALSGWVKKYFWPFVGLILICLSGAGYCVVRQPTVATPSKKPETVSVGTAAPTISPTATPVNNGETAQSSISKNFAAVSDATPPAATPAKRSKYFPESDANDFYLVMLLPSGVDDLKISANGFPVTPIELDGLRRKVFVPPNTTTHFRLECSKFGPRTFDYFPENNGYPIEPFAL